MVPLRKTPDVKKGKDKPPTCEHGQWTFAGADRKRGATKWRCPTGECKPASVWIKADRLHTLIPRETLRWKALYRRRASVERAFGRMKNDAGLAPVRVRRIECVRLHADLTILSQAPGGSNLAGVTFAGFPAEIGLESPVRTAASTTALTLIGDTGTGRYLLLPRPALHPGWITLVEGVSGVILGCPCRPRNHRRGQGRRQARRSSRPV